MQKVVTHNVIRIVPLRVTLSIFAKSCYTYCYTHRANESNPFRICEIFDMLHYLQILTLTKLEYRLLYYILLHILSNNPFDKKQKKCCTFKLKHILPMATLFKFAKYVLYYHALCQQEQHFQNLQCILYVTLASISALCC